MSVIQYALNDNANIDNLQHRTNVLWVAVLQK